LTRHQPFEAHVKPAEKRPRPRIDALTAHGTHIGAARTISLRQLAKHASVVAAEIEQSGESLIVTRDGEPVARIEPLRPAHGGNPESSATP
jgi:hypothetical protein